ncbi:hypothetical protein FE392_13720 [Xenorhabdus sp. 12]|uniref:Uncharacterized protein n=1 Tax=Xenorhabdus santafensis TaxID=2582833 RepID=A0ABU4SC64_9GAMM|nr:hypothetical protein [Xenorhabdus sp. 12]
MIKNYALNLFSQTRQAFIFLSKNTPEIFFASSTLHPIRNSLRALLHLSLWQLIQYSSTVYPIHLLFFN